MGSCGSRESPPVTLSTRGRDLSVWFQEEAPKPTPATSQETLASPMPTATEEVKVEEARPEAAPVAAPADAAAAETVDPDDRAPAARKELLERSEGVTADSSASESLRRAPSMLARSVSSLRRTPSDLERSDSLRKPQAASSNRIDTEPLQLVPLTEDDPAAAYMPAPDTPDLGHLRVQVVATVRRLLTATNGEFTESTLPPAEVPALATAVARLRPADSKRADKVPNNLQGKRLAVRAWYEESLLASSYERQASKGLSDMMHTPRPQSSEL